MLTKMTIGFVYEPELGQTSLIELCVPTGIKLLELQSFLPPEIALLVTLNVENCGVFGQRQHSDYVLKEGDRVEVYRALDFDPMESRRRRATHKRNQATKFIKTN